MIRARNYRSVYATHCTRTHVRVKGQRERPGSKQKDRSERPERNVGEGYLQFQSHLRPRPPRSLSLSLCLSVSLSALHPTDLRVSAFIRTAACANRAQWGHRVLNAVKNIFCLKAYIYLFMFCTIQTYIWVTSVSCLIQSLQLLCLVAFL